MLMVSIHLDKVSKFFGKVEAVVDLTLKINDKEFVALLGPSGCGKTTTLYMIAGIYRPSRGRIYFDDKDVTELAPKDRDVGMVFQSYALYPHMKVYDNIAFPLKLKKLPKTEIDRKVKEVAKMLQIDHLLDRYPRQLSGGQQQRVALARALVKEPSVLLLDEPLSNLDALLRVQMRAELKRLQRELGVTTIYVTHDQVEAMTMADRIAVLNHGRLQQYSTPEELYYKPKNIFVATFIGNPPMNILPARITSSDGDYQVVGEGFRISLSRELAEKLLEHVDGEELLIGVRPEDFRVSLQPLPEGFIGEIYVLEPLGKDIIINVKLDRGNVIKVITSKIGLEELGTGKRIWLKPVENRIHFFNKKTGEAII